VSALTPAAAAAVALRLRVDGWTAEVVTAMRREGIEPILLKGPVIARWLYAEEPAERTYVDCDLLVAPGDTDRARALLATLGFVAQEHPVIAADEHHARIFLRERDGANVDLHRTMHGMEALPQERVWATARRHLTTLEVAGVSMEVPDAALRTLNVALHPVPADGPTSRAWRDLERALERPGVGAWQAALSLARELGIEHELAARLRRLPAGTRLADRLGITAAGSSHYNVLGAVSAGRAPRAAISISNLRAQPTRAAKLRYVAAKLVPPADQLRQEHALARRGPAGLALARALRIAAVTARLPNALAAYRRERARRP
jgi:Uncharacterised nucleotidyltransferase